MKIMKQKYFWITGLIVLLIIVGIILIRGWTKESKEKYCEQDNDCERNQNCVCINKDYIIGDIRCGESSTECFCNTSINKCESRPTCQLTPEQIEAGTGCA